MGAPCVIEVALNGSKRPMEPHEIAEEAIACLDAGATVVHTHTHDALWAEAGRHDPEPYAQAWREIRRARPGALLYPTMASSGPGIAVADRWAHQDALAAEGLLELGLVDPGARDQPGRAVAVPGLDVLFGTPVRDARYALGRCETLGLTPLLGIFGAADLRIVLDFHAAGRLPATVLAHLVVIPEQEDDGALDALVGPLREAGIPWAIGLFGDDIVESGLASAALRRGGHVRCGLEDHPAGPPNVEQIANLAAEARAHGRPPATLEQTRALLGRGSLSDA